MISTRLLSCDACPGTPWISPHPAPMDPYDVSYPPAPIVMALVMDTRYGGLAHLRAFLDTGADYSVLPPNGMGQLIMGIGQPEEALTEDLYGPEGERFVGCPHLKVSLDGGAHWIEPELPISYEEEREPRDTEHILIGRDILSQFKFCCYGKQEFTLCAVPSLLDSLSSHDLETRSIALPEDPIACL